MQEKRAARSLGVERLLQMAPVEMYAAEETEGVRRGGWVAARAVAAQMRPLRCDGSGAAVSSALRTVADLKR